MNHDMKSVRAELARLDDALTRIEAELADLLGVDDPYSRRVVPRPGRPGRANPARAELVSRHLEQLAGTPRYTLQWLEDEGYVTATPGPRNSRMYTSLRPYRAPSPPA